MALLRFSKKRNMANRAWQSFTKKLKSRFRDLQIGTFVRDSTSCLLRAVSHRLIVPFKTRIGYDRRNRRQRSWLIEFFSHPFAKKKCLRRHSESNYLQIYQYQNQIWMQEETRRDEKVLGPKYEKEEDEGPQEIAYSMEDAWKRVVAASPHLRVDERASEFIFKVKKKMRMEKERSLLEFQERLKRSA